MADKNPESNYDKLNPAEKVAVNWFAELQTKQQVISGNQIAIKNPQEYLENVRNSLVTENESGVRSIVEDFNNPKRKALMEFSLSLPNPPRFPEPMPQPSSWSPIPTPTPTPTPPYYSTPTPTPTPPTYTVPTPTPVPPPIPTPPTYTASLTVDDKPLTGPITPPPSSLQLSDELKETVAKVASGVASMMGVKGVVEAISEGLQNIPNAKTPPGKGGGKE